MTRTFPAVVLVARYGRWAALVCAGVVALALLACGVLGSGGSSWALAAGLAVLVWAVLRLVAEVIEVVADTLLPR